MPSIATILATAAMMAISANASALPNSPLMQRDLKTCPALNNYVWTSPSGATQWKIGCNRDTEFDGDHAVQQITADDLEFCIKVCGDSNHNGWCKRVSWPRAINDPGPCYLKGSNTGARIERTGWKLAVKL